ncbi:LolA family protein [Auraticoccus monumenti]|nr:sigma-E factor regulatory protein RseB domain-containing protein [Auraticoccus monumenti]
MSLSRRWIPALVAPLVVAAGVVTVPLVADADPGLPERSAAEVLELVATSQESTFSGTVEQTSELGLPDLGALGGGGGEGGVLELLTSSHEARVYVDGPERSRLQVLDQMSQRDVVRNGDEVWLYDSDEKTALNTTLPEHEGGERDAPAGTPAELVQALLEGAEPTTEVSVTDTASVAGRGVYQLRLDPRAGETLVDFVTVAVDAETGMPLAVQVHAVGQQAPAFSIAFTDLDLDTPDASLFSFTPPPGTEVTKKDLPEHDGHESDGHDGARPEAGPEGDDAPVVSGEGWATVVEVETGGLPESEGTAMLEQLTVPVEGGRALQTSLVSVLLTDDGRVLAGAVGVDQLVAAAR